MAFEPSHYQKDIAKFVDNQQAGHGAVIAVAGSGKTTTCVSNMLSINPMFSAQFNTFNNLIKKATEEKIANRNQGNIQISTFNALGWKMCRERWGYIKLDEDKLSAILRFDVMKITQSSSDDERKLFYKWLYQIKKLVNLCKGEICLTAEDAVKMLPELIDYHNIEIDTNKLDRFYNTFKQTYELSINQMKRMDFADQLFMPVKYNLRANLVDL